MTAIKWILNYWGNVFFFKHRGYKSKIEYLHLKFLNSVLYTKAKFSRDTPCIYRETDEFHVVFWGLRSNSGKSRGDSHPMIPSIFIEHAKRSTTTIKTTRGHQQQYSNYTDELILWNPTRKCILRINVIRMRSTKTTHTSHIYTCTITTIYHIHYIYIYIYV